MIAAIVCVSHYGYTFFVAH